MTLPASPFWIGGSSGAGKTTVTRALACRLGLRAYHVDSFGWDHAARRGSAHERFIALSLDERWVTADPAEMAEWFVEISRERMSMIDEDLNALPDEPLTLVEGPQLLPELLPEGAHSVFLLATEDFRRRAIGERLFTLPVTDPDRALRNRLARDRLLAERIRVRAVDRGARFIEVDGSVSVDRVGRQVEAELSSREPADDVAAIRRWENVAVARQIRLWVASGEGPEVAPSFPFGCECGRLGCLEVVELSVERFDALVAEGRSVLGHG